MRLLEGVASFLYTNHGAQTYKGRMLIWLALQSTGVIYGDIGTRYVFIPPKTHVLLEP
jgi:hypothetical protein